MTTLTQEQAQQALQQQQHHLLSALLPAAPEHNAVQSQHQVSSIQQSMASNEPQLPAPGDKIQREISIDSGGTVKRGNRGGTSDSVPSKLFVSSHHSSDTRNSSSGQVYMEGTFEGGWQSNADLPERREVIFSIVKLVEQARPESDTASKR